MKVGIMSMQRIINYGSFLQAYALKKTIESFGHEVIFVDYHIGNPLIHQGLSSAKRDNMIKRVFRVVFSKSYRYTRNQEIKQNIAFGEYYNKFKNDWLPLLGINEKKIYNPNLDVLVIGSDEVFNCTQSNPEVGFSPELFGINNNAKKVITYAASFGSTTVEKLEQYNKTKEIASYLKKFDAISVRDKNSYDIVEKLIGEEPFLNIDPVLIYDFEKEVPDKVDLDNYVIVYAYSGRITEDEAAAIQDFAHSHGKKTLSIGVMQAFTDEYRCVDPFTMLAYFKNADYVITDTFHGAVFSIKYQIPFVVMIRESNKQKLTDLLEIFGLTDNIGVANSIEKVLKQNSIPHKKLEIINMMNNYKKESYMYLEESIEV